MSTTFEVYSPTSVIPSFNDILLLSNRNLKEKLAKHDIYNDYVIDVCIRKRLTDDFHDYIDFDKSDMAIWSTVDEHYAWFTVSNTPGGCDAYIHKLGDDFERERWEEEFELNERAKAVESELRKCLEKGFYWTFRRSAGQTAIVSLTYGLIAAAFAELTSGYVFSDDSAWDYSIFPATAKSFKLHYFDPQYSNSKYADWASDCIAIIKNHKLVV